MSNKSSGVAVFIKNGINYYLIDHSIKIFVISAKLIYLYVTILTQFWLPTEVPTLIQNHSQIIFTSHKQ